MTLPVSSTQLFSAPTVSFNQPFSAPMTLPAVSSPSTTPLWLLTPFSFSTNLQVKKGLIQNEGLASLCSILSTEGILSKEGDPTILLAALDAITHVLEEVYEKHGSIQYEFIMDENGATRKVLILLLLTSFHAFSQ
jgi:hypothetical protein